MDRASFSIINIIAVITCVVVIATAIITVVVTPRTDTEPAQPAIYKLTRER